MVEEIERWYEGIVKWANDNSGLLTLVSILIVFGSPFVVWLFKKRGTLKKVGKYTVAWIPRIAYWIFNRLRSLSKTGLKIPRKWHSQGWFYLYRKGIVKMRLNFALIPHIADTWVNPYLQSDLEKAGYLTSILTEFMNGHDENQRNIYLQWLCDSTPIAQVLLEKNTLDRRTFFALVSAYVVDKTAEYDEESFASFPIPYSVIEKIIRDLFGEEEEEEEDPWEFPDFTNKEQGER